LRGLLPTSVPILRCGGIGCVCHAFPDLWSIHPIFRLVFPGLRR
jgi:hypothetical protein